MSPSAASRSTHGARRRARQRSGVEIDHGVRRNAEAIKRGFDEYRVAFSRITRRARARFEQQNWAGLLSDGRTRLDLYNRVVRRVIGEVRMHAHVRKRDKAAWARVKRAYAELIVGTGASEIAETFFNSVTRRIFDVKGVDPEIQFADYEFPRMAMGLGVTPYRTYASVDGTETQVSDILADYSFDAPYRDMIADARRIAERVEDAWENGAITSPFEAIEILKPVFYRRSGAYLVGRARGGGRVMPVVIALRNSPRGVYTDAVLIREDDINMVFSFAGSYFLVDVDRPSDTIDFLRSLMPRKPIAELSNALGFDRHGKTELYRHLRCELTRSDVKLGYVAEGQGVVMVVFGMPGLDIVLKVIRDELPPDRDVSRADIQKRYRLVADLDRGGRAVDVHEFDHVVLPRRCFDNVLLDDLLSSASGSVSIRGDDVVLEGLYLERRLTPLETCFQRADATARSKLLADYVQAIFDLASLGIFPGDLLFRNFGVTRYGRVVYQGLDAVCALDDCTFHDAESASTKDSQTWKPGELYPASFAEFVPLDSPEREEFQSTHPEFFQSRHWRSLQDRYRSGEIMELLPYRVEQRIWDA